jgi:hypothetical protein
MRFALLSVNLQAKVRLLKKRFVKTLADSEELHLCSIRSVTPIPSLHG